MCLLYWVFLILIKHNNDIKTYHTKYCVYYHSEWGEDGKGEGDDDAYNAAQQEGREKAQRQNFIKRQLKKRNKGVSIACTFAGF